MQIANRENRRHWGPSYSANYPQTTPMQPADTPTYLSKNGPLAELRLRLCPLVSINRLQTPTKLVTNRAFQIATNKNLSGWKLLCCLAALYAPGTQ